MNMFPMPTAPRAYATHAVHYELRFQSLSNKADALAFPCDREGHVFLDELSEAAKRSYLYARVVIGREFALPAVVAALEPIKKGVGRWPTPSPL
jgi:hypothetical protein